MSIILNIDTSIETAVVSIARDGDILSSVKNTVQKDHARFLHLAIEDISKQAAIELSQLDAIAVTEGPGSYTGLRVGMATAKGLCYALNKPFITIGTLNALAASAIHGLKNDSIKTLICPMIDARRMEVYTAVFDGEMNEIKAPNAMILTKDSFAEFLEKNRVLFLGSGALKWSSLINDANAFFLPETDITQSISSLSFAKFIQKVFSDLTYSEPLYVKDFFSA